MLLPSARIELLANEEEPKSQQHQKSSQRADTYGRLEKEPYRSLQRLVATRSRETTLNI